MFKEDFNITKIKEEICAVGWQLYERGYVLSNNGNISVRIGGNEVIVTPSGVNKGRMTADMLVHTDLDGNILSGNRYPSSEVKMHLRVYKNDKDVHAVIHTHAPTSTAFAVCRRPIAGRYMPEMTLRVGDVPVADFGMPSTDEVPDSIQPYIAGHKAVLLANHGLLTWGENLWEAFDHTELVEYAANLLIKAEHLGGGVELSQETMDIMLSKRDYYKRLSSLKTS